jgi:hypothetical protein
MWTMLKYVARTQNNLSNKYRWALKYDVKYNLPQDLCTQKYCYGKVFASKQVQLY